METSIGFSQMMRLLGREIEDWLDPRDTRRSQITLKDMVLSGLACMFYQDASLLQFQRHLADVQHHSNIETQFKINQIPSDTQIREVLDRLPSSHFVGCFQQIIQAIQSHSYLKTFESSLDGYLCSLDGTQSYGSTKVHCDHCLRFNKKPEMFYSHRAVQAAIVHPKHRTVWPLMPEEVSNREGNESIQDTERKAAFRLIQNMHHQHPDLPLTILDDALYAETPFIQAVLNEGYHYIITSKPADNKFLHEEFILFTTPKKELTWETPGYHHYCRWVNQLSLLEKGDLKVNLFFYEMHKILKNGETQMTYKGSWITDHIIQRNNVADLVAEARCRWKIENKCFNNLKNQGYHLEHNFGHGSQFLSFNFFLLTTLAFFIHQILEFKDSAFRACRQKFGSKHNLWNTLRSYIRIIVFPDFETLLAFALQPSAFQLLRMEPPLLSTA